MQALGIDIGGSGVKGAIVDLAKGELVVERIRLETPEVSTPENVAPLVDEIARRLEWTGPIGVTFPGVVNHGVIMTAANVDKAWEGVDAVRLFERVTGRPVKVLNDADAAGVAEVTYGAGRNQPGVVMMLTFGTGIGSALFLDGKLLPNTELGHLPIRGKDAEHRAAARVRKEDGLSWQEWAERVNEYLALLEFFLSPDLFIIGGGVSKKYDRYMQHLQTRARIVPAQLLNDAGIIGAAMFVSDLAKPDDLLNVSMVSTSTSPRPMDATPQPRENAPDRSEALEVEEPLALDGSEALHDNVDSAGAEANGR